MEFNVSRERVRQIEVRAYEKVQIAAKKSIRERSERVTMHA
jgi:RNA polymerase sigma-32 factor